MNTLLLLATEGGAKTGLWDPKLKGILVVVMAVGLFIGSVYLLLWTNMGASLGFLVTTAATSGIVVMLSILWITGQFYNAYPGRLPKWEVEEVVSTFSESSVDKIARVDPNGEPADPSLALQVKADLDAEITDRESEFFLFPSIDDFQAVTTFVEGGGRKGLIWFSKNPEYAAVEVCTLTQAPADFDELNSPPFVPECDTTTVNRIVVLHHDLGSQRQPAFVIGGGALLIMLASLYGLHLYELRQRQLKAAAGGGDAAAEPKVPATV